MKKKLVTALIALGCTMTVQAQEVQFLSNNHSLYRIKSDNQSKKYLLLPVQESAEVSNIKVIGSSRQLKTLNVRLANNHIDYYVPLCLQEFDDEKGLMLDVHVNGTYRTDGGISTFSCWKNMSFSDTFDMKNREQYRPVYHHTPAYGWMNDPNGMFYKDGVWNLYFQHNPYGSQWENMTWGHSTSTDLVHWKFQGDPVQPDALGTVFSGSAVVDKENTSGFGKGAVIALYTSAGENQTQSMVYSTDNGKTFTKYEGNPVITSNVPDFRDPHMFWNEDIKKWNMIMAVGQHMEIYSSDNLKDWKYESSFGACHSAALSSGGFSHPEKTPAAEKAGLCPAAGAGPAGGYPLPAACSSRPAAPVRSAQSPEPPVQLCVPAPQPACQRTILCTRHGPGAMEPVCASPHPPRQRPAEHQICVFHGGVDAAAGFLRRLYHPCRAGAGSAARQQKPHLYPAGKRYRSRLGRVEPREHLARPPAASACCCFSWL